MTDPLKVANVQFEMAENDKTANTAKMDAFIEQAGKAGADVVCFPEMCLTGYHFLTGLTKNKIEKIAESAEKGPAIEHFTAQAQKHDLSILFGLVEKDEAGRLFNTFVVVGSEGLIFKHRKVHAFENSAILQGDKLETFMLHGWRCGILICYDNNLPENTRVLALQGAEIVFAPHQTGGFDIPLAGMGRIPLDVWRNRHRDPLPMKEAMLGLKGRAWITKWLPSRAYDNNTYIVFSNGVGIDGPEVRVGCSMIIDPEGIIIAEANDPEDSMIIAMLYKEKRINSLASIHMAARRPSLYGRIVAPAVEIDTRTLRNRVSNEKIR